MTGLLDWLDAPSAEQGIRFLQEDGTWALTTYADLAAMARAIAARLLEEGLRRDDAVALVVPSGPAFVGAFFGTLLAGGTPTPLVPPSMFEATETWVAHSAPLMATGTRTVLTEEDLLPVVSAATERAGVGGTTSAIDPAARASEMPGVRPSELALLQFTSGSSGRPRAVRVTPTNLEAMIHHIFRWVPWAAGESGAHWMPLYHDFGLIGGTIAPVTRQRDLFVMRPDQFVRAPERWLDCFGRRGAAFAAAPNFAFSYAVKRVDPETLEGSDFSGWRGAIIGAERIDPAILERFAAMLEPHGFRRETYMPAYGMAEATLGVTGVRASVVARALRPDWARLRLGHEVCVEARAELGDPQVGDGAGWLVGCGQPHEGLDVAVLDLDGAPLPEGHLGEIAVRGDVVTAGYLGEAAAGPSAFEPDGRLRTGDGGFMVDGELHVVGRIGDAIKVRGRTLYAEDLEAKLAALDGVPRGRCVVIPGVASGDEALVAIVEAPAGPWVEAAVRTLVREAGERTHVEVLAAPRGTIKRTSSGKPRRRVLWRELVEGTLRLEPVG